MGEGNESTPLGLVTEIKNIEFCDHEPTAQELADLKIELKDDVYAPLLEKVSWQKGGGGQ
jgi:F420-0:gamma-glutamyl ligase